MIYNDLIFGRIKITEPVVIDLLNLPELKRLKKVDQAGYKPLFKSRIDIDNFQHSRYTHSLGVYLLLKKFNAPIEEQIAGLLHDVSHMAFSHCADYAFDRGSEKKHNFQDLNHNDYVKNSNIPKILKKHNFSVDYILEDKNFPLKENELPDICADRIDYSLRTGIIFREITGNKARKIVDNLIAIDNNWAFRDYNVAKKYAELFKKLNDQYYSGIESGAMFAIVGDYLRHAITHKYISENDMWSEDKTVIDKISKHLKQDSELQELWKLMNRELGYKNSPHDFNRHVFCKSRIIDPFYLKDNIPTRISSVNSGWKKILKSDSKPKEYYIKYCYNK